MDRPVQLNKAIKSVSLKICQNNELYLVETLDHNKEPISSKQ